MRISKGNRAVMWLVVLLGQACTPVGQRPPVNQDRLIRAEPVQVPALGGVAEVEQEGTRLTITVSRACNIRQGRLVDRTTRVESYNQMPALDWLLVGAGAVSIGTGGILLADARNTYPDDRQSRTYNATGPATEKLYGYTMIGAGILAGTVAIVDAIRASGSTETRERTNVPGEIERWGVACRNTLLVNQEIVGVAAGQSFALGKTDASGELELDLAQVVPASIVIPGSGARLEIRIQGNVSGQVGLRPLYLQREQAAFREAAVAACANPIKADACEGVKKFILNYPDGPHAKEARAALAGSHARLGDLADEHNWSALKLDECTKQEYETPDEIRRACGPVGWYLDAFPKGHNVKEARQALETGEQRALKLQQAIERKAREEKAREAADQRKQEGKEAAAARRQCVARCRMGCSGWGIRDQAGCFSGCITSQCGDEDQ